VSLFNQILILLNAISDHKKIISVKVLQDRGLIKIRQRQPGGGRGREGGHRADGRWRVGLWEGEKDRLWRGEEKE
jgi:hypothetical protein